MSRRTHHRRGGQRNHQGNHQSGDESSVSSSASSSSTLNYTMAASKAPAPLSPKALIFMILLAFQFGIQPILTQQFTSPEIIRSTVIFTQEIVKLLISIIGITLNTATKWKDVTSGWSIQSWLRMALLPATIYLIQNLCSLLAYQNLDAITYNVLNQTKTLSAALCCYLLMGKRQSKLQIVALVILLLAALVMEGVLPLDLEYFVNYMSNAIIADSNDTVKFYISSRHVSHGVIPVMLASFLSGLAGAITQKNLQSGGGRNALLFTMELSVASILILLVSFATCEDGKRIQERGFFCQWTFLTLVPIVTNSAGGILVGLVTKYAGTIRKGFALIFGILISGIVQTVINEEKSLSKEAVSGGVLAAFSLWMHASFPYIAAPKTKAKDQLVLTRQTVTMHEIERDHRCGPHMRSFKTAVVIISVALCGVGIRQSSQNLSNWRLDSENWVKYKLNPKHEKKILYVVRSCSESCERLDLQAQTWMNHLDPANDAVFVASQSSPNELEKRKYAHLPFTFATPNCTENDHSMGICCHEANAFLVAATTEMFRAFDWVFVVDDDAFVSPSILRQIVQEYDETTLVSIGSTGCISESYSGFCGGGYLVSNTALKKIAAVPSFASEYMNICNKTNKIDIATAWMLENEANVTLVNERRFHPWGMEVAKVLDKNYENEAWQLTHRLIHRRQHYLSHPQKVVHNVSSLTAPLPTVDMFDHLLKTPKVLQAVASRQYATLHYFGGDLTEEYSTKSQKFAFLNLLYDVALDESEQAEDGDRPNKKDQNISNVDHSKGQPFSRNCLSDTRPHPVPHRESPISVLGPDRESPISVNPKPGLGSIRTIRDHLEIKLQHLDESSALEEMRLLTFEKKCVRNLTPKKFHWIWLGSELPEKYVTNIEQMAVMNPGWEVFLWSEYESKVLLDRLEKDRVQYNFKNVTRYIQEGLFINGDLVTRDTNMAGKSDYLRFEVVYLEGGIYQDTDVSYSPARIDLELVFESNNFFPCRPILFNPLIILVASIDGPLLLMIPVIQGTEISVIVCSGLRKVQNSSNLPFI